MLYVHIISMSDMRPFRFGILTSSLPVNGWIEDASSLDVVDFSVIHKK